MASIKHSSSVVRDAKTGTLIPQGYGALKGQFVVRKGIDVTKPIYEQAAKLKSSPKKSAQKPRTK